MGTVIPLTLLPQRDYPWQCPLFELIKLREANNKGREGTAIQGLE
jgi:hypothetical protein